MALVHAVPVAAAYPWFALACLLGLIGLLGHAACSDLRHRHISNPTCLAIAMLAIPYWLSIEPTDPGRFFIQFAGALTIGALLILLFVFGQIGGGDVKMLAATALWLRPRDLPHCLAVIAIAGGMLGLLVLIADRRRLARSSVPYGVAIAIGVIAVVAPRFGQLAG